LNNSEEVTIFNFFLFFLNLLKFRRLPVWILKTLNFQVLMAIKLGYCDILPHCIPIARTVVKKFLNDRRPPSWIKKSCDMGFRVS